jgi:beta-galactosidase
MGEFHFSRYPRDDWEDELRKMKAGGIDIAAAYNFWIHHEEIEGRFDRTGNRDLRHFTELCARVDLFCYPRIGPWAHGEARNGGFPDWLLEKCAPQVRKDAPSTCLPTAGPISAPSKRASRCGRSRSRWNMRSGLV